MPQALVLDTPRDVDDLPGFAQGVVSVQDLGAQCVAFPLSLEPGQRVLDACAAPGRQDRAHGGARAGALRGSTAVDIDRRRLTRVRENLERGGLARRARAPAMPARPRGWWDGVPFDRILLDAPCSALGVIRRHPDIRLRRSPKDIDKMPPLQGRLLERRVAACSRAAGRLVYCHLHAHPQRESAT